MQNNERREHILEKIFQECVFYSFLIESAELEYRLKTRHRSILQMLTDRPVG